MSEEFILLITGSREASDYLLERARAFVRLVKEVGGQVVVGDAEGVDATVIRACDELGVPVTVYGAYGKLRRKSITGKNIAIVSSYLARDREMVRVCTHCVALWNGRSRGTKYTYDVARRRGKPAELIVDREGA